jgi:hypothetical protein
MAQDDAGNVGPTLRRSWSNPPCPPAADVPTVSVVTPTVLPWGVVLTWPALPAAAMGYQYRFDGVGPWHGTLDTFVAVSAGDQGLRPGPGLREVAVRAATPAPCEGSVAFSGAATVARFSLPLPGVGAPVVVVAPPGSTPSLLARVELAVEAPRPLWRLQYSLDGAPWAPCAPVLTLGPLRTGALLLFVAGAGPLKRGADCAPVPKLHLCVAALVRAVCPSRGPHLIAGLAALPSVRGLCR